MKNVLTILLILTILISGCTTTGTNVYGRTTVATTNRTLGKLEENVAKLKEFLRDNPEWAFVHYALGIEYAKLGRYPEAMAKFEDALRINPRPESPIALSTDRNAILGYEKARQKLNQALEENIQKYKKIVSENPDNAEAHKNLGSSYYFLGRYQEAVAELEEALRIDLPPIYEQVKSRDFFAVVGSGEAVENGFCFPQLPRTELASANSFGV